MQVPKNSPLSKLVPSATAGTPAVQPQVPGEGGAVPSAQPNVAAAPSVAAQPQRPTTASGGGTGGSLDLGNESPNLDLGGMVQKLADSPIGQQVEAMLQKVMGGSNLRDLMSQAMGEIEGALGGLGGGGASPSAQPVPVTPSTQAAGTPATPGTSAAPKLVAPSQLPVAVDGKIPAKTRAGRGASAA